MVQGREGWWHQHPASYVHIDVTLFVMTADLALIILFFIGCLIDWHVYIEMLNYLAIFVLPFINSFLFSELSNISVSLTSYVSIIRFRYISV